MSDLKGFKKCKLCGIPLNREIQSESDPKLCFECAEEKRKFTVNVSEDKKCTNCGVSLNAYNTHKDSQEYCKDCYSQLKSTAGKKTKSKAKTSWLKSLFKR